MMNYDDIVQASLQIAQSEALERMHTELDVDHLFWGLIENPMSLSHKAFRAESKNKLSEILSQKAKSTTALSIEQIRPTKEMSTWLTKAQGHAAKQGRSELKEKDLLMYAEEFLKKLSLDFSKLKEAMKEENEQERPSFIVDLNELAEQGKLDPVIGRHKEIRSVMEILGRRSKNNPVLVGSAGVGKTAIVEGLARAIVKDEVPDLLKTKRIYSLDLGQLVAGTKYRGDFEKRINELLSFVKSRESESILFIDEIHQLIGTGKTDGAMDAANLLKPALARGELHCIGATTDDEFREHILKDPALERRFRKVPVQEPTRNDALEIMMGIRDKFEAHHGIKISDEAIVASIDFSIQYMSDKMLPDKSIDLIDEAASSLKLAAEAMPSELEDLKNTIRNKKTLLQVGPNEALKNEVKELEEKFQDHYEIWLKEVKLLKNLSDLKVKLDQAKFELEVKEREQNYEEASRLKYSVIPELEKEIEKGSHSFILKREDVAQIISRHTGVPVHKILQTEQEDLLDLARDLKTRVFGQDEAIDEISDILLTSLSGLSDPSRPLGSFLLMGPTGVGKTETAKALAQRLFSSDDAMTRIDLSEFSEKHAVAKLIGSPAGYVGYEDGGVLTEAVRKRPYQVLLFDEVEKAHPDFSDILLQVLDDGRLSDNHGRVIDFKNTIIIMTTNSKDPSSDFRPEVLGRFDARLRFKPLQRDVMHSLVQKHIKDLRQRLSSKKINITFDQNVIDHLSEVGYDEAYGARPLAQVFSKLIIRPLSRKILSGDSHKDYDISYKNGEISIL